MFLKRVCNLKNFITLPSFKKLPRFTIYLILNPSMLITIFFKFLCERDIINFNDLCCFTVVQLRKTFEYNKSY